MPVRSIVLVVFALLCAGPARADGVLERIRAQGIIRCGGAPRTGLVGVAPDGRAQGLYLDLCRAIGAAVLGPEGRIEFHVYDSEKAFAAYPGLVDDVSFLSASEILDENLAGKIVPGPPAFFEQTAVMVPDANPARDLAGLAGQSICFSQGSGAHRDLEAWSAASKVDFDRRGYQEDVELHDAYDARSCAAQAGEAPALAALRLSPEGARLKSRILTPPLAVFPILVATPITDGRWAAIVSWAMQTLQAAEIEKSEFAASGFDSLAVPGPALGLSADWRARVVRAAGNYADIYARNLGANSPLALPRGPNSPARLGGLFTPAWAE